MNSARTSSVRVRGTASRRRPRRRAVSSTAPARGRCRHPVAPAGAGRTQRRDWAVPRASATGSRTASSSSATASAAEQAAEYPRHSDVGNARDRRSIAAGSFTASASGRAGLRGRALRQDQVRAAARGKDVLEQVRPSISRQTRAATASASSSPRSAQRWRDLPRILEGGVPQREEALDVPLADVVHVGVDVDRETEEVRGEEVLRRWRARSTAEDVQTLDDQRRRAAGRPGTDPARCRTRRCE